MTCRMKVAYCSWMTGMEAHRIKPRHSRDVKASEGTVEQRAAAEGEEPGSEGKRGCEQEKKSELSKQNQVSSQHQLLSVADSPPICQSNVPAPPSFLGLPNSLTETVASEQVADHSWSLQPGIREDDDGYYCYHRHL